MPLSIADSAGKFEGVDHSLRQPRYELIRIAPQRLAGCQQLCAVESIDATDLLITRIYWCVETGRRPDLGSHAALGTDNG